MLPEKFVEDLESSNRRKELIDKLGNSIAFLAFFLVLGALIHEFAHIGFLQLKNCPYSFELGFSFLNGLFGEVDPLCSLNSSSQLVFYSIGYISTFIAGSLLTVIGLEWENRYSDILIVSGTGALLSVLLSIGSKGDLQNFMQILNINPNYNILVMLFIVIGVFLSSLKGLEMFIESERKE